jgi:methionine sulfoxide reductase catalytic subunit
MTYRPARPIAPSEITPQASFADRRRILAALGGTAALALGGLAPRATAQSAAATPGAARPAPPRYTRSERWSVKDAPTSFEDVTSYNNFYEFGTDKTDPKANGGTLRPRPWSVEVAGAAEVPGASRSRTS